MTDLTLHDDIDRLDTGITRNPDVSGIISAARGAAGAPAPS